MTNPTSTDRDREAIDELVEILFDASKHNTPALSLDEAARLVMGKLRALGMSMPYDEPTEAMVEAATVEYFDTRHLPLFATKGSFVSEAADTRNRMYAALVAAAKARGAQ